MKKWSWLFTFVLTGILLVGCSAGEQAKEKEVYNNTDEASEEPAGALKLMENEKVGEYLTDSSGMALYYFAKDKPNMTNCNDECIENWPAFYSKNFEVPQGFNQDDFGTITRDDTGKKQTTFKGYPLYYFVNDKATGDVNGQGVKDVWFIVNGKTTFTP